LTIGGKPSVCPSKHWFEGEGPGVPQKKDGREEIAMPEHEVYIRFIDWLKRTWWSLPEADELVRGYAAWALGKIGGSRARQILEAGLARETAKTVGMEIEAALAVA